MSTALIYLVVMVLVAAVIYLLASAVFGRGEELAPLPPGASPTRLPADEATGDDIRAVRFQQVLRGYKMSEVDWVLSRLSKEVDELRSRLAELEGVPVTARSGAQVGVGAHSSRGSGFGSGIGSAGFGLDDEVAGHDQLHRDAPGHPAAGHGTTTDGDGPTSPRDNPTGRATGRNAPSHGGVGRDIPGHDVAGHGATRGDDFGFDRPAEPMPPSLPDE